MFVVRQTEEFVAWLDALRDKRAQARIAARLRQVEAGNLGDGSPAEGEVSAMRIHFGPGYRLYFTRQSLSELVMEMRAGQLLAAVKELCSDLHGRGLWDATDAELLEAVWQFRRDFEKAASVTGRQAS
jgi:putative addiction module killer protein